MGSKQTATRWGSITTTNTSNGKYVASQSVETNFTYGPYKLFISQTDQTDTRNDAIAGTWWNVGSPRGDITMTNAAGTAFDTATTRKNIIRALFRL